MTSQPFSDGRNKQADSAWAMLQQLEALLKVLGALLAVVIALGTPAVIVQYKRFKLPLQFVTHEGVIRAGILPSIAIGAVAGLAYLVLGRLTKHKGSVTGTPRNTLLNSAIYAVIFNLLIIWSLFSAYVLRKLNLETPPFRSSWHVNWKVRVVLLSTSIFVFAIGWFAVKVVRRICQKLETPDEYRLAKLGIAVSFGLSLFLDWALKRTVIPGLPVEPFLDALAIALFLGLFMILITLSADLPSRSTDVERKKGLKQLLFVIALIYLAAVLFYSVSWYGVLPHYIGGGKPTPVTVWIAKTANADPALLSCAPTNSDFARCEHLFMISVDSDYYILALSSEPTSRGVVLPRQAVALVSGSQ